jgi:hypothetical protein
LGAARLFNLDYSVLFRFFFPILLGVTVPKEIICTRLAETKIGQAFQDVLSPIIFLFPTWVLVCCFSVKPVGSDCGRKSVVFISELGLII